MSEAGKMVVNFVWGENNGVIAIMREMDALKSQNIPGTRLHNPAVPLFTFASHEACDAAERVYGGPVYTGTFDDIEVLLGEGWQSRHHEVSEWFLSGVSEWRGYVPFSSGIRSRTEEEDEQSWWHFEASYRTTVADLVYVFFDGDLNKYKEAFQFLLRKKRTK